MSIFIKNKDGFGDLRPTSFPLEIDLSNLIIDNPEIFPITKCTEEGTKWIPISVEVKLETGELDILGIDDAGGIYIIESKLYRNEEKKTVRQQVTDYYYALLKLKEQPTGWEKFCDKIKTANKSKEAEPYVFHNKNLEDVIKEHVEEDFERCLSGIKNSFEKGKYTLVVAMDRIPKKLRTSIDGQNEIDAKNRIPTFALEINEFETTTSEKIVTTSTYPYDLAEIKQRKPATRGEDSDKDTFQKYFEKTKLTDEQRRKFNEVRKVIEKPAREIFYGANPNNPIIYPYYDTVADGDRAPVSLGSDGCFQFKLDALYGYVKNAGPSQETKESELWKEQILSIPELKKFYGKRGWNSYLKPEEWMPVHKEIIKILKVLITNE